MSVYLSAAALAVLRERAATMPAGAVVALDPEGNWYRYLGPMFPGSQENPDSWPEMKGGRVQLYRDYWRYCPWAPTSPYGRQIVAAAKTFLRGDAEVAESITRKPRRART